MTRPQSSGASGQVTNESSPSRDEGRPKIVDDDDGEEAEGGGKRLEESNGTTSSLGKKEDVKEEGLLSGNVKGAARRKFRMKHLKRVGLSLDFIIEVVK